MLNRFGKHFEDSSDFTAFAPSRKFGRYTKDGNDHTVHNLACKMVAEVHDNITDEFFNRKKEELK